MCKASWDTCKVGRDFVIASEAFQILTLAIVKGKDKQTLNEAWHNKFPDTYKTVNVHGYPNAFILLGPSSLLGHNSVLIMAEW